MSHKGARTATGGAVRADPTVSSAWPDRDSWAQDRQTVYGDDVDKVVGAVSADPADYATAAEITQATAELGDYRRQLGRELREANQAALAVFPLHGHRARRRASIHAILRERDRLSEDARAVVEHAEALKDHRKLVNDASEQLHSGRLRQWTVTHAERWMPRDACPTWRAIINRWNAASEAAVADYTETTQRRPVDDDAWRRELDRRAGIELARARGHIGGDR